LFNRNRKYNPTHFTRFKYTHQLFSARTSPRTLPKELTAFPRSPSWNSGLLYGDRKEKKKEGREGKGKGRGGWREKTPRNIFLVKALQTKQRTKYTKTNLFTYFKSTT